MFISLDSTYYPGALVMSRPQDTKVAHFHYMNLGPKAGVGEIIWEHEISDKTTLKLDRLEHNKYVLSDVLLVNKFLISFGLSW